MIFLLIKYSPFLILFISDISSELNNNDNLKNVNPVENISLFYGLNSPKPEREWISNNSGDI